MLAWIRFKCTWSGFFGCVVWIGCAALLSACGKSQHAFFYTSNPEQSLTIVRDQAYVGGSWESALIVAGLPNCQRRYVLKGLPSDQFKINVYQPEPDIFILNTDKRWYVTSLENCAFQTYQTPPPEPGDLLGSFSVKEGQLTYAAISTPKTGQEEGEAAATPPDETPGNTATPAQ